MKRLLNKLIKMARTVNIQKMRGIIKSYGPRADPIGLPAVKVVALFFFPAFPLLFFRVSCSISASCYNPKSIISQKSGSAHFRLSNFQRLFFSLLVTGYQFFLNWFAYGLGFRSTAVSTTETNSFFGFTFASDPPIGITLNFVESYTVYIYILIII